MAVAVKCIRVEETRRHRIRHYALTLSGSYVTGGDTVDFTTLTGTLFARRIPPAKPLFSQDDVTVRSSPNGYDVYLTQNGSSPTLKNYLLKVNTTAAAELTAGAYPAGLTALAVEISVTTPKSNG